MAMLLVAFCTAISHEVPAPASDATPPEPTPNGVWEKEYGTFNLTRGWLDACSDCRHSHKCSGGAEGGMCYAGYCALLEPPSNGTNGTNGTGDSVASPKKPEPNKDSFCWVCNLTNVS